MSDVFTWYEFNEESGLYVGTICVQEDPKEPGLILSPANATPIPPPGMDIPGVAWQINSNRTAWTQVPDYSNVPLWSTETSLRVESIAPGRYLPPTLTDVEPPIHDADEWPVWDAKNNAWQIGLNMEGAAWHHPDGRNGTLSAPWSKLPEGAMLGLAKELLIQRNFEEQMQLLLRCKSMIESLELQLAMCSEGEVAKRAADMLGRFSECRQLAVMQDPADVENFSLPKEPRYIE